MQLASILMYGSNGKNQIAFVDCVFLCVSAICVCGLATVNLSTLTGFQQAILFVLMLIGNPVRPPSALSRADLLFFPPPPPFL
jgi:Trk-type K+ transport system membrane component